MGESLSRRSTDTPSSPHLRKRLILLFSIALLAVCAFASGFDSAVPMTQRNAILFSWDGVQRQHLMECLSRNELPHLAALIREGKLVNIEVTSHRTETKPGHVQMLTGYDPDVTGTKSNGTFRIIPQGLSIFERLEQAFGKDGIATIMITGAIHHIGACPPAKPKAIAQAIAQLAMLGPNVDPAERERLTFIIQNKHGEPFYHVRKNIDFWEGEVRRDCEVNGPIMLDALDRYGKGRFFAFCHFRNPDHAGHMHGENSREYNHALIACDQWVGKTIMKLKALGIYNRTMIFATSDHGFEEGKKGHRNAPHVYLIGNMRNLEKSGDQGDIVPTILTEMGVDISKLRPKYTGTVLTAH